jgi:hypothetical protein
VADEAVLGVATKLGLAVSNSGAPPADPAQMLEFLEEDFSHSVDRQNFSGIRGTRSMPVGREAVTRRYNSGSFRLQPTPVELSYLLQRILGGTPSGSPTVTYPLGETLPYFDLFKNIGITGAAGSYRFNYRENVVTRATFSAAQGDALALTVEGYGKDRDEPPATPATWPALNVDYTNRPWIMHECVLTTDAAGGEGAAPRKFKEWSLVVDNQVDTDRFLNSVTPTEFPSANRVVEVSLNLPWGGHQALLDDFRDADVAIIATFTNAGAVLVFSMPHCIAAQTQDPTARGKQEVMFPFRLFARSGWNGSAIVPELSVTLNPGP